MKKMYYRSSYLVVEVVKTASPKVETGAPNDRPVKTCPDLKCSEAGLPSVDGSWKAQLSESTQGFSGTLSLAVANERHVGLKKANLS
jgi:hypothetical protein